MSKRLTVEGIWVTTCDWVNPETGKPCDLGIDGEPQEFVDPESGRDPKSHYQCGRHHGLIPQAERPEFQTDTELGEDILVGEDILSPAVLNGDDDE
jgi:hypothetical protein